MCTNKDYYRSISLRKKVYGRLGELTEKVMPGAQISRAKVVEKLINDKFSSLNATTKVTNETAKENIKI
tara:strand:+ start:353 stop:559 length:207 start_codon:yes stop_codon:yes gene_type:complete